MEEKSILNHFVLFVASHFTWLINWFDCAAYFTEDILFNIAIPRIILKCISWISSAFFCRSSHFIFVSRHSKVYVMDLGEYQNILFHFFQFIFRCYCLQRYTNRKINFTCYITEGEKWDKRDISITVCSFKKFSWEKYTRTPL